MATLLSAELPKSRRFPFLAGLVLSTAILGTARYAGLTANLVSENFNIAQALVAGDGYANATGTPVGPTAWCAPVYPFLQASLLWLGDGSRAFVQRGLVALHVTALVATALLVLALVRQTTQ